jgi:site-specific recombinase XerD
VQTKFQPTAVQHLYRREPIGVYYARLYAGGRNKWISLKTKVFSVAKLELLKHLQSHHAVAEAETRTSRGKATVGDLAAIYLQEVELDGSIKASTKEYRGKTIKYLFRSWPGLSDRAPNRVSETECRHWAAEYRGKFSETLFNNTLDSFRHIFDLAAKRGLIARNPAAAVEKVKVPQKKLELPSGEQFKRIVELIRNAGSATSDGCGDLVEFLAYSGLRATEAAGVRWQDIDLERARIYVAPGKTGQARYVPLLDSMRDLLARIKAEPRWFRAEHRRKAGHILSVSECEKALTSACAKAGAHRMTRHDLRHLFATRCIESGVDIRTVSRWLGHKDGGALAMKTYGHLRHEHSQAMAKLVTF